MFGKKYKDMDAIEKHHYKNNQAISITGLILFFGIIYSYKMIMNPGSDDISELNFLQRTAICMLIGYFLIVVYYSDKNKFSKTRQIKSFAYTFICLSVILFNIGLYFYL